MEVGCGGGGGVGRAAVARFIGQETPPLIPELLMRASNEAQVVDTVLFVLGGGEGEEAGRGVRRERHGW